MNEKQVLTQDQITDLIGAAKASDKLIVRVETLQELIAKIHGEVEAMRWPGNLIGHMELLLEQRDYNNITNLLSEWNTWLQQSESANESMRTIAILIKAYVEDYNGDTE